MNGNVLMFFFYSFGNLMNLIEGFYYMKCIDCCLKRRNGRLIFPAGLAGYTIVSSIVIYPDDLANISLAAVFFGILNFLIYDQGQTVVKLALIIILLPVSSALNFLVFDISTKLYFQYFTADDKIANCFFSNFSVLPPAVFFIFFYRAFHKALKKMQHTFTERTWCLTALICTASFAGVFSCLFLSTDYGSYYIWPCMLACILTNTCVLWLASCLADGIYADLERKNLRLQQNYYEELEKNQNQIRKLRHDMNSHLAIVGQLLKKGETENAETYFSQISSLIQDSSRRFCQNSVVNAVLNARYSMMQEAEIDSFFHISIDGMMLLDDVSLCTIFANTLDNAIEACQKIKSVQERKIQLKCRYTDNGYFCFELVPSRNNAIAVNTGQFISDKEDRRMHGIGISSVRSIVDKYQGTLDISYDECSFKVVILIG